MAVVGLLLVYVPLAITVTFAAIVVLPVLPAVLAMDVIILPLTLLIMLVMFPVIAASVTVPDIMLAVLVVGIMSVGADVEGDADDVVTDAVEDTAMLELTDDDTAATGAVLGHGMVTP